MKNNQGFSIIQALIALGIVASMGLQVAQITINANRSTASIKNNVTADEHVGRSFYYLSSQKVCNTTDIIGTQFNPSNSTNPVPALFDAFGKEIFPTGQNSDSQWIWSTEFGESAQMPGEAPCDSSASVCQYVTTIKVTAKPKKTTVSNIPIKIFEEAVYLETAGEVNTVSRPITACSFNSPITNSAQIESLPARIYFTTIDLKGSNEYCKWFIGDIMNPAIKYFPVNGHYNTDGGSSIGLSECHGSTINIINAQLPNIAKAFNKHFDEKLVVSASPGAYTAQNNSPLAHKHAGPNSWQDLTTTFQIVFKEQ